MSRRLGIVFAHEQEKNGLTRLLYDSNLREYRKKEQSKWQIGNLELTLAVTGASRDCAAKSTELLIEQGNHMIISAGFAGALDLRAETGSIFVADRILYASELPIPTSASILSLIPPSGTAGHTIWRGDMLTVNTMGDMLRQSDGSTATALDMQSYWIAQACKDRRIPFASIRSIVDAAIDDNPAEMEKLSSQKGFGKAAFLLARPYIWKSTHRLYRNSMIASRGLGDLLGMIILRLSR